MTSEKGSRRDKNQNIQVFVRLRPLNQRERDIKSLGVIEVVNAREVVVRSQQSIHTKKFTFDRAFGPSVKQVEVYQQVVSPLIEEVLCGYNCTVFAYGQTGTGKTHTMVGESTGDETNWQSDPLAGIIPRALSQLFDELRISNTEYTVRVSYLELYNEELFDLLSSSEDNSKLRIYEDVTRKGANIVNGLEEITVYNKNEVYKIMAQGQERKRVASTLMNAQSSRSHTVFTIVVHMKENSPEGEELVKIGKLNLVDLAGSENISKAGSDNPAKRERARECVNINQSLLTLGRVITALVERHPHIPYRESKLTRILQESLGGRTKTSIIATISPGHKDIEETMSTLEYAHRAKNIQNKPEVNQKMTKKAIMKEFVEEIDKLKRDLQAARDKNGIYLANETFTEMTLKDEEQRKEIQELLLKKRAMEEEKDRMENVFSELSQTLQEQVSELHNTRTAMESTREQLVNTKNILQTTKLHFEEQKHLVGKHRATEQELSAQARRIIAVADTAADHVRCLHESVDKRRTVESTNIQVTQAYRQQAAQLRAHMAAGTEHMAESVTQALSNLHEHANQHTTSNTQCLEENRQKLDELIQNLAEAMNQAKSSSVEAQSSIASHTQQQRASLLRVVEARSLAARAALAACAQLALAGRQHARGWGAPAAIAAMLRSWLPDGLERVSSLARAAAALQARWSREEAARAAAAARQRDQRQLRAAAAGGKVAAALAQLESEKSLLEDRLSKQLTDIEQERVDTESRLTQWMDEERKLLEERLARHVASEKEALENRLARRRAEVDEERKAVEERVRNIELWRQEQMAAVEEENQMAETYLTEYEAGRERSLKHLQDFEQQFAEGTTALSADLEAFSANLVQVSEHYGSELLQKLTLTTQQIEQEASAAVAAEEQASAQLVACAGAALDSVLEVNTRTLDSVLQTVQGAADTSAASLTAVSSSTAALAAAARGALAQHGAAASAERARLLQFCDDMRRALAQQEQLEGTRLGDEFRLYSPTGKTPARQEYRFPRALAATSPPERILARFRAMRRDSCEQICVIESDPETRAPSDCESSTSEDSALAFTTPSPPSEVRANAICKSTSESDLFYRKQPPGKENPQYRTVSHKKTSRLPAPTSHKKPLVERN